MAVHAAALIFEVEYSWRICLWVKKGNLKNPISRAKPVVHRVFFWPIARWSCIHQRLAWSKWCKSMMFRRAYSMQLRPLLDCWISLIDIAFKSSLIRTFGKTIAILRAFGKSRKIRTFVLLVFLNFSTSAPPSAKKTNLSRHGPWGANPAEKGRMQAGAGFLAWKNVFPGAKKRIWSDVCRVNQENV